MASTEKRVAPPPYTTYKSFRNFINGLRENGMPSHITRSMLTGSNSGKATLSASLKSLGLVTDNDEPTLIMKQLVDPQEHYSNILRKVIEEKYELLSDPDFDLANTTTEKVAEKFKSYGATGSTVTKCMAFFLAACEETGIKVSQYVKAPAPTRNGTSRRRGKDQQNKNSDGEFSQGSGVRRQDHKDKVKIPIPLHGMEDGLILFPEGMNKKQWEYAQKIAMFLLENYRPDFAEETDNDLAESKD